MELSHPITYDEITLRRALVIDDRLARVEWGSPGSEPLLIFEDNPEALERCLREAADDLAALIANAASADVRSSAPLRALR